MSEKKYLNDVKLQPDTLRASLTTFADQYGFTYNPNATAPATYFSYDNMQNLWGDLPQGPLPENFNTMGLKTQNVYVPGYFGDQKPILQRPPIMTSAAFRRRYLTGLDSIFNKFEDFQDQFDYFLDISVAEIEAKLGLLLYPRVIITDAVERGFRPGIDFDFEVREQDFIARDFFNWGWNVLQYGPIMSITAMNMVYPTGQEILNIPMSWIKPQPLSRQIRIVPPQGALSQVVIGPGGFLVTLIGGMMMDLPALLYTDYVAGMWPFPAQLINIIAMQTAIHFFEIASDIVSQGMREYTSTVGNIHTMKRFSDPDSRKGATQAFEPRIRQYEKAVNQGLYDFQRAFFTSVDVTII